MVCGWTWQSMWAGEEQYLEGMVDWDGVTNRKYDEYKKIATEFKKIEKFFPYKPQPEVGLAFSFPSQIASAYFPKRHDAQLQTSWDVFFHRNMDANVVELTKSTLKYKLLVIPGVAVVDQKAAVNIRNYVKNGGTVIMTNNSAIADENGQVFRSTRPGLLNDVFGIRLGSYEETENLNEISPKSFKGKKLQIAYKGKAIETEAARFDIIDVKGAATLATITSLAKEYPVVTSNNYGKGRAIYIGIDAEEMLLGSVVDDVIKELGIKKGPEAPEGVMARQIDKNHYLYLNTTGEPKKIDNSKKSRSILFDKNYEAAFTIAPYEPEFIEIK